MVVIRISAGSLEVVAEAPRLVPSSSSDRCEGLRRLRIAGRRREYSTWLRLNLSPKRIASAVWGFPSAWQWIAARAISVLPVPAFSNDGRGSRPLPAPDHSHGRQLLNAVGCGARSSCGMRPGRRVYARQDTSQRCAAPARERTCVNNPESFGGSPWPWPSQVVEKGGQPAPAPMLDYFSHAAGLV